MKSAAHAAQLLLPLLPVMSTFIFVPSAALSQDELSNNQPLTKKSTEEEARIQAKLKLDFTQGLIDSTQLASMQRDFDAILVKEDDYKARGMTDKRKKIIADLLQNFEATLDRSAGVHTTEEAKRANGPVFNKNNDGTSNVVPTR
jgi:hypothetical protein